MKLLRIPRLAQLLDVEKFKIVVTNYHEKNLRNAVLKDKFDYFYPIMKVINAVYSYKIASLLVVIISLAYFLGLIWIIISRDLMELPTR